MIMEMANQTNAQNMNKPYRLMGMGHRRKLLYRSGQLFDPATGEVVFAFADI